MSLYTLKITHRIFETAYLLPHPVSSVTRLELMKTPHPLAEPPIAAQTIYRRKWTPKLIRAGWTTLPNAIIHRQAELGLDSVDLNIILFLASYWWRSELLPRPSKARMAAAMKLSERTIQRQLTSLHERGLVRRIVRGTATNKTTNAYDLGGLILAATPYAVDMRKEHLARKRKSGAWKAPPIPRGDWF